MTSKRHQTSPEIREQIRAMRADGQTCKEVARCLGVSQTTVKNYTGFYRKHSLTRKPIYDPPDPVKVVKPPPPREQLAAMVRNYKARQFSLTQIGTLTHLPYRQIIDLLGDGNGRADTISN